MRTGALALSWILLAALLVSVACDDGSAKTGEGCVSGGGMCTSDACGESLPYPCPGTEVCCRPAATSAPHDAGGG